MRHSLITMMMAAAFIACSHHVFAAKKFKSIEVETAKFAKSDSTAEVSVLVQWPVKGDKAVVDSLRKHINYLLCSELNSPDDVKAYGESLFESLSIDWHSVYDEMAPEERLGAFTKHHEITIEAQTNNYITYFYRTHEYQGGIHGFTTEVGFTFRKSDGKQIPLLADTDSPELAQLIKKGVKQFFAGGSEEEMNDEAVLEYLFITDAEDLNRIPLPGNPPYLSKTGLVFLYTQYEIAPYSSGIITFEVPFKDIMPFLTPEAKELIP